MGCTTSTPTVDTKDEITGGDTPSRYWFRVPSEQEMKSSCEFNEEFSDEHEFDRTMLELRALMNYPIGRQYLVAHCENVEPYLRDCLYAWLDITSFEKMVHGPAKWTMARSIYEKYIDGRMIIAEEMRNLIAESIASESSISSSIFDGAKAVFFRMFHEQMFLQFKDTGEYKKLCVLLRKKYNRAEQQDFWYHQLIGQGGFGLVADVTNKSTGVRYAMKLLRKDCMARVFANNLWRVDMEKRAFASCHHPFIVELHFAFQTEFLVAMVITLGTGRDLSKILKASGALTIEQVRFYAAEITSALSYIHDKGLVYRDLKPGNILLNMDGHVQLVDFGGVADTNGKLIDSSGGVPLVSEADSSDAAKLPLSRYWSSLTSPRRRTASTDERLVGGLSRTGNNVLNGCTSCGPDFEALCHKITLSPTSFAKLKATFPDISDAKIIRHAVACGGSVSKTIDHIAACLLWREQYLTFTELPKFNSGGENCTFYHHGFDHHGHPLLIMKSRYLYKETRDINELFRWFVYTFELAIQRLPPHLEQFTVLVSRIGKSSGIDYEIAQHIGPLLANYYPNRFHKILCYPSSAALRTVGGIIKSLMQKVSNVEFVETFAALRKEIPDEYIPEEMGGSCCYEFDIADCPAPVVCESYEYCRQHNLNSQRTSRQLRDAGTSNPPVGTMAVDMTTGTHEGSSSPTGATVDIMSNQDIDRADNPLTSGKDSLLRANSIVGTYSYMAPEMVLLMVETPEFIHTGYTKAVDWWSLGVTVYRLLSGNYPFETDILAPKTKEEALMEGSNRYSVLLEKVDYSNFGEHSDAIDFMSKLLTVDDSERLGNGVDGSKSVSQHTFFRNIDWVELEQKQANPPQLPGACKPHKSYKANGSLEEILRAYKRPEWCGEGQGCLPRTPEQINLENALNIQLVDWEYTSPKAVLAEIERSGGGTCDDSLRMI